MSCSLVWTVHARGLTTTSDSGPSLLELLDTLPMVDRRTTGPVMMPISEKYKDMGTVIVGKVESGRLRKGDHLVLMPNKVGVLIG